MPIQLPGAHLLEVRWVVMRMKAGNGWVRRLKPRNCIAELLAYLGLCYLWTMRTRLADPSYEPTDEELRELSRAAFSDVAAKHRAALAQMWEEIAKVQKAECEALGLQR